MDSDLEYLKNELHKRKTTRREEIKVDLKRGEELGDLFHENFPYDEAVAAQRLNEARIVELSHAIDSMSQKREESESVQIGNEVVLEKEDGTTMRVKLVDDAVFRSRLYPNAVTPESPIGKAILEKLLGDIVVVQSTKKKYLIMQII